MVLKGFPWVGWARLMGPGGGFTFFLGRLGEWQSEHLDLMSIAILIQGCGSHHGMSFAIEAGDGLDCEFTESGD